MSIARHHAEWLSLLEASGPFLSLPVLLKAFPSGLDAHEPEHLKVLRLAYEEWQDSQYGARPDKALHRAWVEFVLRQTLELPDEVLLYGQRIPPGLQIAIAEHGETLRPDWVVVNPQGTPGEGTPRLLVQIVPAEQDLEKPLAGQRWKASPATRMMELLHACNVRLGLVTNGEHWMLVNAPKGETTGFISWYSTLWLEEHLTLRAFRSLLAVRRFFGVDEAETLEALLTQSVTDQQEVTDQLGYQVRQAVEVLVQALDRIDQDRNRTLLQTISEPQLYEAALTVMMRLVFLFSAEERNLIPSPGGEALYQDYYAVSTIRAKLRSDADKFGEEVLERRSDAWCRLLATFRAVHGGIRHDLLDIPAYGGSLFDPDRFPFLEGRMPGTHWQEIAAEPIPVNNRIVLHLLEALQILRTKIGGTLEPRRLSFRALDIEQIGHVYEGLLDHTAVRATSPVLGLIGTRNSEPEVPLETLEAYLAKGEEELLKFLKQETGRSLSALRKALTPALSHRERGQDRGQDREGILPSPARRGVGGEVKFLTACNNDQELLHRVLPFAGLIRLDTLEYPMVIPTGSVYVTQGSNRRETGTHYTPRSLTEPIVQYTLEPLVYQGVVEGKPKEQWRLKSAQELLELKVCDMAMGSGAFLVQTCRYLAERLVEAWEAAERKNPGKVVIAPEGTLSKLRPDECPIPKDTDERLTVARRIVAERCLYGVDKNPLAVEMAKLSLWLITLAKGRPFTFLDHALKCGDSLVGVNLEQLRYWNLDTTGTPALFADKIRREVERVIELRRQIAAKPGMTAQDQTEKGYLLAKANAMANDLRDGCDLLVASYFNDLSEAEREGLRQTLLTVFRDGVSVSDEVRQVLPDLETLRPFHWELEFPEVFLDEGRGGFDVIVGNPPFMGGGQITSTLGSIYAQYLHKVAWSHGHGNSDLVAYFFLQSSQLLKCPGCFGLLATKTIAQGDTADTGLRWMLKNNLVQLINASSSHQWPGLAAVIVSLVMGWKGVWHGKKELDGKLVKNISPTLDTSSVDKPKVLASNSDLSSEGSKLYAESFVLNQEQANFLINNDPHAKEVVWLFNTGQDFNQFPDQRAQRWCIDFQDKPLDYVIERYPKVIDYVEKYVKPERENISDERARKLWWQHQRSRIDLYRKARRMDRVLCRSLVTYIWGFAFVSPMQVFANKITVFLISDYSNFAVMQSTFHEVWAWNWGSTRPSGALNYSHSDCFQTFPFPEGTLLNEDEVLPNNLSLAIQKVCRIGEAYHAHRHRIMLHHKEGLTATHHRFHNPDETAADIQQLRSLHVEMDYAVAAAYGWTDLDLEHNFHDTKQGLRFTISETTRREVLDRLLLLNHERYAEEVAQGLHDKKKKRKTGGKKKKKTPVSPGQISLF